MQLIDHPFVQTLSPEGVARLFQAAVEQTRAVDEVLLTQNGSDRGCFLILEGAVHVEPGQVCLEAGMLFGATALLSGQTHVGRARIIEPLRVAQIEGSEFLELVQGEPGASHYCLCRMAEALQAAQTPPPKALQPPSAEAAPSVLHGWLREQLMQELARVGLGLESLDAELAPEHPAVGVNGYLQQQLQVSLRHIEDVAQLLAPAQQLRWRRFSCAILGAKLRAYVPQLFSQSHVRIECSLPDIEMVADRSLLLRMLIWLLEDAVERFSGSFGVIHIQGQADEASRQLRITLRDNHPVAEQSRVTALGTRAQLVAWAVARHGGRIHTRQRAGKGSWIGILLPLEPPALDAAADGQTAEQVATDSAVLRT